MKNKFTPGIVKNGSDVSIDKGIQSGKKHQGMVARFFAWIARGTKKAARDGSFCTR